MSQTLMSTYKPLPVTFTHGEGAWLWDDQEHKYLDAMSGIAVCGLGHAHPAVTAAVCEQAGRLVHTSNLYHVARQQELADRLTAVTGMDRAFFCNSGAEANEAAIKLARLWGHRRGVAQPTIIVMEGSFHGRTLATLTATGNRKVQAGFEPLVQGFVRAAYDDLEAIEKIAAHSPDVVAVLVEPVQGEGGIRVPGDDYLAGLRESCDRHGWLLMFDEIQTGIGRSGHWLASQRAGVQGDVVTLAKGLGNGVPIGACLARGEAAEVFQPGNHGSTFGGNPLASAAALAVLQTIEDQQLAARAASLGDRMLDGLRQALGEQPGVIDVRGLGLLLAIELAEPCAELVPRALEMGLLINVTAERVVRLLPPLILTDEEADHIVAGVSGLIKAFLAAE
ncbi:MAG: aspartate aminotransferase family protein [Gammaproteobacteria bacterium]